MLLERGLQGLLDRCSRCRVLARFDGVTTDNVAAVADTHLFDFKVVRHPVVASGPAEDFLADLFLLAHAAAEDVVVGSLGVGTELRDRRRRDHAAIGDHHHPADLEALPQPLDHRRESRAVGGIPWQQVAPGTGEARLKMGKNGRKTGRS